MAVSRPNLMYTFVIFEAVPMIGSSVDENYEIINFCDFCDFRKITSLHKRSIT